ncbi:MAG: hypothetical protein K2N78_03195 [Oscillospiraceae bacterium]|nr:hypothetical protein [Oscillospiraceae bacterium]
MSGIFEQLKKEALYAQRSLSTELLYQTHGAAQMARYLTAITAEEFHELNDMTVRFMNTDREYIRQKNREFAALCGRGGTHDHDACPAIETANDLDGDVGNLFRCIRQDPERRLRVLPADGGGVPGKE